MNSLETKALEESAKTASNFFSRIFGPAADAYGLMKQDNMNLRRLRNQIKNLEKIKKIVEEEGIEMKQVNLKALVPLLEGIGLEEEETLQDIWANLFANYIDSEKNLTVNVYPEILKQLSTNEVVVLKFVQNHYLAVGDTQRLPGQPDFTKEELSNLQRLGLIEPKANLILHRRDEYNQGMGIQIHPSRRNEPTENIKQGPPLIYNISSFGDNFLIACSR